MRPGKMSRSGHVVIARAQFADSGEVKLRPAVVLFEGIGKRCRSGYNQQSENEGDPSF